MEYHYLDNLIDYYVKNYYKDTIPTSENKGGINVMDLAKEKLKETIIAEIDQEKEVEYRQKILHEMKHELEMSKIKQIETFIFDGILLAFLIGLVVNQSTDIITWIKTQEIVSISCIYATIGILTGLSLIIWFALKFRYFNKIFQLLGKSESK